MPEEVYTEHPNVMHRSLGHEVYTQLVKNVDPMYVIGFLNKAAANRDPDRAPTIAVPVDGLVFGLSLNERGMLQMAYQDNGTTDSFAISMVDALQIAQKTHLGQRI